MNKLQVQALLTYASAFDNRLVTDMQVAAWMEALATDMRLDVAKEAIRQFSQARNMRRSGRISCPPTLTAFGPSGNVTISLPKPTLRVKCAHWALRVRRVGSIGGIG